MYRVPTKNTRLEQYNGVIPDDTISDINRIAAKLKGARLVHVNATPAGGGVAEILQSLVPMMRSVGIDAEWYALEPNDAFFKVSKTLHHCLQGDNGSLSGEDIDIYLEHNLHTARCVEANGITADLWLIHDAQVLPLLNYLNCPAGVWICHIDTTTPNEEVRGLLRPYMDNYEMIVASMPEYLPAGNGLEKTVVFPPAIDPMVPKHEPMSYTRARDILASLGIDPASPLVSQLSRFDHWKDPWGVIDAYRLAREKIPGLQLALVGAMSASDDFDAFEVLDNVREYTGNDPDIHLYSDPQVIRDTEVNAFQSGSDVIIQKSIREGFGLTVTEAMWKARPVIGGNCGGIKLQIDDGVTGFLVDDVPSCALRIVTLLKDPEMAKKMGEAARESVRRDFLMPRLLKDYLTLAQYILEGRRSPALS